MRGGVSCCNFAATRETHTLFQPIATGKVIAKGFPPEEDAKSVLFNFYISIFQAFTRYFLTSWCRNGDFCVTLQNESGDAYASPTPIPMAEKARLYLLPVPVGDTAPTDVLPARNIEILRTVKHFVVENVRSARRFLKACDRSIDIDSLTLTELSEHTRPDQVEAMLEPMTRGLDMGVISEAGCPAVADPGADAVAIAQRRGYDVVPLVGPSSIILSLMASGFNGQSFAFCGYLPIDDAKRTAKLKEMTGAIRHGQTQIFIETPYRNNRLIEALTQKLPGDLKLCVASDITGPAQSIITLPLSSWRTKKYNYDKIPTIFLLYR